MKSHLPMAPSRRQLVQLPAGAGRGAGATPGGGVARRCMPPRSVLKRGGHSPPTPSSSRFRGTLSSHAAPLHQAPATGAPGGATASGVDGAGTGVYRTVVSAEPLPLSPVTAGPSPAAVPATPNPTDTSTSATPVSPPRLTVLPLEFPSGGGGSPSPTAAASNTLVPTPIAAQRRAQHARPLGRATSRPVSGSSCRSASRNRSNRTQPLPARAASPDLLSTFTRTRKDSGSAQWSTPLGGSPKAAATAPAASGEGKAVEAEAAATAPVRASRPRLQPIHTTHKPIRLEELSGWQVTSEPSSPRADGDPVTLAPLSAPTGTSARPRGGAAGSSSGGPRRLGSPSAVSVSVSGSTATSRSHASFRSKPTRAGAPGGSPTAAGRPGSPLLSPSPGGAAAAGTGAGGKAGGKQPLPAASSQPVVLGTFFVRHRSPPQQPSPGRPRQPANWLPERVTVPTA